MDATETSSPHLNERESSSESSQVIQKDTITHDDSDVLVVRMSDDLETRCTIKQLKDMCTQRGLAAIGKKKELVERILAHDRSDAA